MFNITRSGSGKSITDADTQPPPIVIPGQRVGAAAKPVKPAALQRSKPAKYKKREYTQDEVKELLKGYVIVAPEDWASIPRGSHIRYFKKDGSFVRGGFVVSHWQADGKAKTSLANSLYRTPNYTTWPMYHDNVQKIFKKIDPKTQIEIGVVRNKTGEMITEINKLVKVVKAQKNEIDGLKQDVRRLFTLVRFLSSNADAVKKIDLSKSPRSKGK